MNQLLIVNSQKAINAKADITGANVTPNDLSNLAEGAITFFELGGAAPLAAAPTKDFAIALGRKGRNVPFIIPEVDLSTLSVTKTLPSKGVKFNAVLTPATGNAISGANYSIVVIKLGTVPNERNMFSVSTFVPKDVTKTNIAVFKELGKQLKNKAGGLLNVNVTLNDTTGVITVAGVSNEDGWTVKFGDEGFGVVSSKATASGVTTETYTDGSTAAITPAKIAVGDKAFISDLAQKCAGGKGFNLLDQESQYIYPGYPEAVEDLVPNDSGTDGVSTAGYAIYTLRFATGRKAGKQTDERVWQNVFVAVPITASSYSTIDTILSDAKDDDQAEKD